ncbi:MAG: hypothetical protein ACYS0K_18265 [Planctomycetota bacterium]|jgi:hypothetical protein
MTEGKRPGGLTAMAVFNFIGTGLDLIGVLVLLFLVLGSGALVDMIEKGEAQERAAAEKQERTEEQKRKAAKRREELEEARKNLATFEEFKGGYLALAIALNLTCATLLLLSGIGYLKQKRFLGRKLGIAYALVSIPTSLVELSVTPAEAGGGFSLAALVAFIYPVLTLILLNTTFREDFIN